MTRNTPIFEGSASIRTPHLAQGSECSQGELTRLLSEWRAGHVEALDRLVPLVYGELRRLAQFHMASEKHGHTLQATAVVNEAYLKLLGMERPSWQGRAHFFAVASLVMRRILLDHARARLADKRDSVGQGALTDGLEHPHCHPATLVALDTALQRLFEIDRRAARVVELRYFGGLTVDDVSEVLAIGPATVIRDWRRARAWLMRELS